MRTLNRSIALGTQITDLTTTSAPQLETSPSSIVAYVQKEKARVGSHPPSTLVVAEIFATDPRIHYLAKLIRVTLITNMKKYSKNGMWKSRFKPYITVSRNSDTLFFLLFF